jgi:hypothetical protein
MVHYRGGRRRSTERLPRARSFWADLTAAYREEVRRLGELGCTYLQFDDTSLAYMNDPAQREYVASIGGDADRQHVEYIHHINEALAGRPREWRSPPTCAAATSVVVGRRGRLRLRRRGALQRARGRRLLHGVGRRALGGFEPLRFVPKGKVVVLGLVTTKRGELESKDELKRRIEEARGSPTRAALPLAAVRLLLDGRGQRPHGRAAGGEAPPDRGGRRRGLGVNVREATFELFRRRGLTTMFANPGRPRCRS